MIEVILPRGAAALASRVTHAARRFQPQLEVKPVHVQIADLPAALDGFLVVHLSDFHVGNGAWRPYCLDDVRNALHAAEPDVVVNTGDYLQDSPPLEQVLEAVRFVRAGDREAANRPQISVLGNHDYYAGEHTARELTGALRGAGVTVLTNELQEVEHAGARLTFTGLNPYEPGLDGAIGALGAAKRPVIVLAHEPEVVERLPHGSADLALTGHTHGGQITAPFIRRRIVKWFSGSQYGEGMFRINGIPTYVNRGLGFTGVPFRWGAAPEVTLIRLVR